ncbi:hypothetical protein N7414_28955 [Pseudomonas sp. GD04087]|uniref:hypothetical protein n=1 Tax=unclassified Pseudomonas TaxID=196821 RepID=UPI0024484364|nr:MULTISPECIES: hypothetical protein [unclassified Pseudomonas]MDH0293169.1 hypothetical protein [Pseudomonas sp. GD04087]MDH1052973.1 hypothetical protein [Pseudomonas sp. GD03903]MDH2003434.1 hypothetical protein [Pseudomonas sp. GD03691]
MWKKILRTMLPIVLSLHGASAWAYYLDRTPSLAWSNEDVIVSAIQSCDVEVNALGWPPAECYEPYLKVEKKNRFSSDKPFVAHGDLMISDEWNRNDAVALYQAVLSDPAPAPVLRVVLRKVKYGDPYEYDMYPEGRMVVMPSLALVDFHSRVSAYIQREEQLAQGEAQKERINYALYIAIPLILLTCITLLGRYLYRNRKRIWDRSAGGLLRWKGELAQSLEDKRVRRIAIDEAVRLSVQNSVNSARSGDTEELERMIEAAIKRGDTEAAAALNVALKRIAGTPRE